MSSRFQPGPIAYSLILHAAFFLNKLENDSWGIQGDF